MPNPSIPAAGAALPASSRRGFRAALGALRLPPIGGKLHEEALPPNSRRGFLRALAGLPLAGVSIAAAPQGPLAPPAPPAAAPAPAPIAVAAASPDAGLLAMIDEWWAADAECAAADEAVRRARDATPSVAPPAALFARPADGPIALHVSTRHPPPNEWRDYFHAARTLERDLKSGKLLCLVGNRWTDVPLNPRQRRRVAAIVAAAHSHWAAQRAADEASGLVAARAAADQAQARERALRQKIAATPALSISGAIAVARCAIAAQGGEEVFREAAAGLFGPQQPMALTTRLTIDLARLAGGAVQDAAQA